MKVLVFTIYAVRVGDTKEWPISTVIADYEEEIYREYQVSRDWNEWADRNRVYRNARIEVVPFEFDKHRWVYHSTEMMRLLHKYKNKGKKK